MKLAYGLALHVLLVLYLGSVSSTTERTPSGGATTPPPASNSNAANNSAAPTCVLSPTTHVRDELHSFLLAGANLVYVKLQLEEMEELEEEVDDPESSSAVFRRLERDLRLFQPWAWQRSSSRQGRSLLMLSENYDVLSMTLLSIRVHHLPVTLTSSPPHCVTKMTSREVYETLRALLLNDFKPLSSVSSPSSSEEVGSGSLSRDEHVCHRQLRADDEDEEAEFQYMCCHLETDELVMTDRGHPDPSRTRTVCRPVVQDRWIALLLAAVTIIKVLVVLFSPNLLPSAVYRLKYATLDYIVHLPKDQEVTVRIVKTATPWLYGSEDRVVRLSKLGHMPRLSAALRQWRPDRVRQLTIGKAQLAVKARKLLQEHYVPVGVFRMLYNNLFLCRLRHISSLTGCCSTNILGMLNPGLNLPTWFKCARLFARAMIMMLFIMPWIVRLLIYYQYERPVAEAQKKAAELAGLEAPAMGSLTLYLTPLHGFFLVCYVILALDSLVYGVLTQAVKEKLKLVLRRCLRDMRERSKLSVCGWATSVFMLPCSVCGVLGLLLFPLFLILISPLLLPILAFYLLPAVNLSMRLLFHLFIFLCPPRAARFLRGLWQRVTGKLNQHVHIETLTAEETFESRKSFSKWELPFQVLVVLVSLVSFWSLTFLLMELLSFVVEMAVYTFIGLIVTADVTMQYLSVLFFLFLYANRCFAAIHSKYLQYHKFVHNQLLEMTRAEIDKVARDQELDQENTALRVQGSMAPPSPSPPLTLTIQEGRPRWSSSSFLLFLDRQDTPYTPERFFGETLDLHYCGCPGPLYANCLTALWSFTKIIIFLLFVLVVVMAFGSAYSVSSSNQLLATVAGGFIPFVFTHFFAKSASSGGVDAQSVQFKTHFHAAINSYVQNWPVYDLDPSQETDPNLQPHRHRQTSKAEAAESRGEKKEASDVTPAPLQPLTPLKTLTPSDVPPLSTSTPYNSTYTSKASSDHSDRGELEEEEPREEEDWEDTPIDLIVDVSGKGGAGRDARALSGLQDAEAGSQTMLNRSRDGDDSGGNNNDPAEAGGGRSASARRYRPSQPSLRESDELLDV